MTQKQAKLGLLIVLIVAVLYSKLTEEPTHKCKDQTHQTCDGGCQCDGMECKFINN